MKKTYEQKFREADERARKWHREYLKARRTALLDAATFVEAYADNYPADVWPEDGEGADCKAAKMARHLCRVLADRLGNLGE